MSNSKTQAAFISLDPTRLPRVLLLGNGILRLCDGISWNDLLNDLKNRDVVEADISDVPFCMKPEVLCDLDAEEIRRKVGARLADATLCITPQLEKLLSLDFDCILTTNYTYEIERVLTNQKWDDKMRRKCVRVMDGSSHVRHNTNICYEIPRENKPPVQVWHIHGDALRHTSMILSYYSYANAIHKLQEYNKHLGDAIFEHQQEGEALSVRSWLDWFLVGDVYTVGYSFDFAEIDLWWALERKKREHASVGKVHYMNLSNGASAKCKPLLEALGGQYKDILLEGKSWAEGYDAVIDQIAANMLD